MAGAFDRLKKRSAVRAAATGTQSMRPEDRIAKLKRYSKQASPDVGDMERILALDIVEQHTPEQVEAYSREHMQATAFERGDRFFATQSSALEAFETCIGGFFPIGVGWGKTGISLYTAELGFSRMGIKKILLLVPSQVYAQLTTRDIAFWSRMVNLSVPIHRLGGQPKSMRLRIAKSGRKGLYLMPYSLLSTSDSLELLCEINADLVIADEVHNLKDKATARTKRLFGWRDARDIMPAFVGMSGTITSKSVKDYHHLVTWALGDGSPLPKPASMAEAWGEVIDSGRTITGDMQTGPLRPLVSWASKNFSGESFRDNVSDFRRAYKLRLTSAPGVVATGDAEISTSLVIETTDGCGQPGPEIVDLINAVQHDDTTPNGDQIAHAIHRFKWINELTAGFYNELIWPTPERLVTRHRWSEQTANDALRTAKDHHALQQAYHKELRSFLQDAPLGCDTPMEVARQINQNPDKLPFLLTEKYQDMKLAEEDSIELFGVLVERERHAHRIDDYKVRYAIDFARKHRGGLILWYYHNAIGAWLHEMAVAAKLDHLYAPAGQNEEILDKAHAGRVVIASMTAHGTGKNLQHFSDQFFVQWPRDSKLAEQVLGRTHRNGQEADTVAALRYDATAFDSLNFAACLCDAVYTHQSTDLRQKVVYATHNPLPRIFTPEFLREQGADPAILNPEQRSMMEDLFGDDWLSMV